MTKLNDADAIMLGTQAASKVYAGANLAWTPPYAAAVLSDSPAAYWRLGESSPSQPAADASGNGWDGTYSATSGATFGADSLIVGDADTSISSAAYAASGDYIMAVDPALFTASTAITVEFWADLSLWTSGTWTQLVDVTNTTARQFNLHFPYSNSQVIWDCGGDSGGYDRLTKTVTAADLTRHHWAFVKDAAAGTMTIYQDGVVWASATGKTRALQAADHANVLNRGVGQWDEFAVYHTALPQARVQAHYANGSGNGGSSSTTVYETSGS